MYCFGGMSTAGSRQTGGWPTHIFTVHVLRFSLLLVRVVLMIGGEGFFLIADLDRDAGSQARVALCTGVTDRPASMYAPFATLEVGLTESFSANLVMAMAACSNPGDTAGIPIAHRAVSRATSKDSTEAPWLVRVIAASWPWCHGVCSHRIAADKTHRSVARVRCRCGRGCLPRRGVVPIDATCCLLPGVVR